jgi:hypothetical protein
VVNGYDPTRFDGLGVLAVIIVVACAVVWITTLNTEPSITKPAPNVYYISDHDGRPEENIHLTCEREGRKVAAIDKQDAGMLVVCE